MHGEIGYLNQIEMEEIIMEKRRLYAAYGSNMNLEQMSRRCKTAKVVGCGLIEGYTLIFKGMPNNAYATIEPVEERHIKYGCTKVVIWELQESDEQALDIYEGYPRFYKKKKVKVKTFEGGDIEDVMVYIMNEDLCREVNLPSDAYYQIIKAGYFQNDLSGSSLMIAYGKANKVVRVRGVTK